MFYFADNVLLDEMEREGSLRLTQAIVSADDKSTTSTRKSQIGQGKKDLSRSKSSASRQKKELKMFQLSLYLAIAVFVCCGPVDLYYLMAAFKPQAATFSFYIISNLFNFFHCILNPVLYARSTDIQTALTNLFPKRNPPEPLL